MPADKQDLSGAKPTPRGGSMAKMMARTGVAIDRLGERNFARVLAYAGRNCLLCRDTGSCRMWLDEGGAADKYREFCPNAALFDDLPRADDSRR